MPDRIARGLWPHPPLKLNALARHVVRLVKKEGAFPYPFAAHVSGEPVAEGGVIERRGPLWYVYRSQRPYATDPFTVAEVSRRTFFSPMAAAKWYLRWDLYLPGDLDGWKVV